MNTPALRCLLIAFLAVLVCCEDGVKFDPNGNRYLPLQVGNYWKLVAENTSSADIEITVVDEVIIHEKNYFKLYRIVTPHDTEPITRTYFYLRTDEKNYVYVLNDSAANVDLNVLRLGAPDGYSWAMSETVVYVSTEPEQVNGSTLPDCKTFFYNDPTIEDEEQSDTYAADIGYCRIWGGWGRYSEISVARINGVEHHF